MGVPAGITIQVTAVRGNPTRYAHIDYKLLGSAGQAVGAATITVPANAPTRQETFEADGTAKAWTTKGAPYDPTVATATPAGATVTANVDGTVTAAYATPPAAGTQIAITYPTGPGLDNRAGSLVSTLGLTSGSGTVWSGTVGGVEVQSASPTIAGAATVLYAWATALVTSIVFGG